LVNIPKTQQCKVIYSNYDTLEVSLQGCLSEVLLNKLCAAKKEAQAEHRDAVVRIGDKVIKVSPGGIPYYKYAFSTGDDGEMWFVKHSQAAAAWNIQVKIHSLAFASYGYAGAKIRLFEWLEVFGAIVTSQSIKRVDFCVDFLAPTLDIDLRQFRARTTTTKRSKYPREPDADTGETIIGKNLQTATVGMMPGQQVCIYNKRVHIIKKHKEYWWLAWGIEPTKDKIWRVEMRAGKTHIKDKWRISTFEELEQKSAQIFLNILKSIRYMDEIQTDTNSSRQKEHELWPKTTAAVVEFFKEPLKPYCKPLIHAIREQKIKEYLRQFQGMATGLACVMGFDRNNLDEAHDVLSSTLHNYFRSDEKETISQIDRTFDRINEKFCFYNDETGEIVT
jgi:hypothetical protein